MYRTIAPRREHQRRTTALAIVLLAVGLVGFVAHQVAVGQVYLLGVVAISPYLMSASVLGALLLLIARRWAILVLGIVLVVACASTQARLYRSTDVPSDTVHVTVMTSNLRLGSATPSSLVAEVRRHRPDVLMLEELTPQEQVALARAGLDKLLPHHVSRPSYAARGTGLWSRYPLTGAGHRPDFDFEFVYARVKVPEVSTPPIVVALHMSGPYPDASSWNRDIARLPGVLRTLAPGVPALVGGDFNATPDTAQFRVLLRHGYHDAAEQAGAGVTRSYPSDKPYPPLIAIDHVLTRDAVARTAATVQITGTDHRALVSSIAVPRDG